MKTLTVAYITARDHPEIEWFRDSVGGGICLRFIIVSERHDPKWELFTHKPKPTIWQGPNRLTRQDWFAAANARNTAIALCDSEWIAFLDDRCVLCPGWMEAIRRAMCGGYAICGAYEKRHGMKVNDGHITDPGIVVGQDARERMSFGKPLPIPCGGEWWFGCNTALPLEWALEINGYDESCDGLGMEDVIFGLHLQNAGYPIRYDPRMKIIEDRTPEFSGPIMKRTDKGISPNDKSHALLNKLRHLKRSTNPFDLRAIRNGLLNGDGFPDCEPQTTDWFDGQPIGEM